MGISDILIGKIDAFMKHHVIHQINPNKIHWWVSLSGGKDSYSMARVLYDWYKKNNCLFHGIGFYINQWGNASINSHLCKTIDWMPIIMIDGTDTTMMLTNYSSGMQAPCSKCSTARKIIGDQYIMQHYKDGYYNVLARGLHLSDMAISYLWRDFWGIDTISFANKLTKGKPFERLPLEKELYLAKPLCYVREYECEEFARITKYTSACCGCPACRYPSRRDIVEESLKLYYPKGLWEFEVRGIKEYLNNIGSALKTQINSMSGIESKCCQLPPDFALFAIEYWKSHEKVSPRYFSRTRRLDDIGHDYLVKHQKSDVSKLYLPKFYSDEPLSAKEKIMIATVGPFWGGIGFKNQDYKSYVFQMQYDIFNIEINKEWSQVIPILEAYYEMKDQQSV